MNVRFYMLVWLGPLLMSCDNPPEASDQTDQQPPPRRITKSDRSDQDALPATPERLRESLKKAEEIESPIDRNKALGEVIWDSLELDPALAEEGFHQLVPGSVEKNQLIQHFAMRMAEESLDDAIRWAMALETEKEKSLAFDNIALVLAETEPEEAARMLSESGVVGRDFDVAIVQVVQRWASMSPQDAAAWVVLFQPGEARRAGLKEIASAWSRSDPESAVEWIATIQDPSIHQEAVSGMALSILELPEGGRDEILGLVTPEIQSSMEILQTEAAKE